MDGVMSLDRLLALLARLSGRLLGAAAGDGRFTAPAPRRVATLIRPIFDDVLPTQHNLLPITLAILAVYFLKGLGGVPVSLSDGGRRPARRHDLRNELFRHMLGQSAAFFSLQTTGRLMSRITNDVGQVQRAVSETIGDLARETLSLVGFAGAAVLLRREAGARLPDRCAAGRVSARASFGRRVRRTTRRSQEALEQMSHVSAEAFTGHRIVKAFGAEAREAAKFERASDASTARA